MRLEGIPRRFEPNKGDIELVEAGGTGAFGEGVIEADQLRVGQCEFVIGGVLRIVEEGIVECGGAADSSADVPCELVLDSHLELIVGRYAIGHLIERIIDRLQQQLVVGSADRPHIVAVGVVVYLLELLCQLGAVYAFEHWDLLEVELFE